MSELPYILSLKSAAHYLGISEPTLRRRIQAKSIKANKDGGYWKIKRDWLMEYQNALLKEAGHKEKGIVDNSMIEQEYVQKSENMHISQFPQETQDFIHKLCAKAILRAIRNGGYINEHEGKEG
ncbi:excisionase family DNA-binding protein [Paenibacillus woosongensis]|uniref:Helix-turn-helix domain-containing protein n=1 Tax=Paenibacillus woosongensis TaxID=307580 RepID=A0ABQ4MXE4_9BACL|nr:excisionase family DNA-binding protein [Paenibacillus woosongensis]GIP60600.1 hypothetical protein J15TS10_44140 [Paenibacillus woosongensis]